VNREAQGVVLFVVGAAVLRASLTDLYLRYVRAGLRPFLVVAGIVLIIAAVATFWYELRPANALREKQRGRAHHEPRIAWLLVLPVFALILVAPPALGSYAANRTGTALQRPAGFPALAAGDPLPLTVLDYATRAVYDRGNSLAGRQIKIIGFITVGRDAPYLTRMVLSCCAADALPVKVGLSGKVPTAALRPDTWLEVTGTYTTKQVKDHVNDATIPFIEVSQARAIPAPHDRYES
jgi:uncharacterized repeat protein (TIGR03943 family)